jgi:hypothetical protein
MPLFNRPLAATRSALRVGHCGPALRWRVATLSG